MTSIIIKKKRPFDTNSLNFGSRSRESPMSLMSSAIWSRSCSFSSLIGWCSGREGAPHVPALCTWSFTDLKTWICNHRWFEWKTKLGYLIMWYHQATWYFIQCLKWMPLKMAQRIGLHMNLGRLSICNIFIIKLFKYSF